MSDAAAVKEAVPAAPEEQVTLVNTGKAKYQILPGIDLLPNSGNTVAVAKPLAEKLRRAYPAIKNVADVFSKTFDIDGLKRANAALEAKAQALEKALGLSDDEKKALRDKVAELEGKIASAVDAPALEAQVKDLQGRLAEFLGAGSKKELDALQEKHADAVPAAPAAEAKPGA